MATINKSRKIGNWKKTNPKCIFTYLLTFNLKLINFKFKTILVWENANNICYIYKLKIINIIFQKTFFKLDFKS